MNDKLKLITADFERASLQLQKALQQPKDEFVRDSAIQRFEFTFELFWKVLKEFALSEGLDPRSPRASISTAFELGLIQDEELFLKMLESRNLASHTYLEENAEDIYTELPVFLQAMGATVSAIKQIREQ
jgi:nucleotidyltransferase substrate binding protein (TIGR01987 family)